MLGLFSLRGESKAVRRLVIWATLFVFALSACTVLLYGDYFLLGTYEKLNNDDVKYVNSARVLLDYHTLAYNSGKGPTTFIMPGLPFLISGMMLLFGQDDSGVIAFRLLQAAMQAFSVYLIFILGRAIAGRTAGIVACLISVVFLPDYFSSGVILTETTFKLLFLLLLLFTIAAVQGKRTGLYVVVAILWAASCYFKPQTAFFPVIFLFMWLREKYTFKEMAKYGVIMAVVCCTLMSPWWIRNYVTFGKVVLLTESSGNPLLLGAFVNRHLPSQGFFDQYPQYKERADFFIGYDKGQKESALRIIRYGFTHEPLKYAWWYTAGKVMGLFENAFYWRPIFGVSNVVMNAFNYILVAAGFAGMAIALARRKFFEIPVMATMLAFVYFILIYLPFVTFSRYGYTVMFILIIFASYAFVQLAEVIRKRKRTKLAASEQSASEQGQGA